VEPLKLHDLHQRWGAHFARVAGAEFVDDYGDPRAELAGLQEGAAILDLSFRSRLCLTGADRVRFLHGQVTNDVNRLALGEGCYAALITAKGRMQSDLYIYRLEEELLLDFEPGLAPAVRERLDKYVIADDVQVVDVAAHYGLLSLQGPQAESVLKSLALAVEVPAKAFNFVKITDENLGEIYLVNQPRLGTLGFDLFVPTAAMEAVAAKMLAAAPSGVRFCGWQALETARLEVGIPRFGADMDDTTIPLEAGLESRAISFSKGCYIGQEVISRIHTYGQVAKALRRLRLADNLPALPARGDKLYHQNKEAGYLTSAARSPRLSANPALGYVRKEADQPGAELTVRTTQGESAVRIEGPPYGV